MIQNKKESEMMILTLEMEEDVWYYKMSLVYLKMVQQRTYIKDNI
jgi:hypothetical protein